MQTFLIRSIVFFVIVTISTAQMVYILTVLFRKNGFVTLIYIFQIIDLTIEGYTQEYLNDHDHPDFTTIRIVEKRRSEYCFTGPFIFGFNTTNDVKLDINLYKFEDDEFRLTDFNYKKVKCCDAVKNEKFFYPQVIEHTTVPKGCPIPKGKYEINWCPNFSTMPPNINGRYKIEVIIWYRYSANTKLTFIGQIERRRFAK